MNSEEESLMFTVDGAIQGFHIAPAVANLFSVIQTNKNFNEAISELTDTSGAMSNSTRAAMYDGEYVEHIALLINGKLAIGTFEWLRDLEVGDDVTLVVTTISDGPLLVHAILRKNDQLLWTPHSVAHTCEGLKIQSIKMGDTGLVFSWSMFGLFSMISESSGPHGQQLFWIIVGSIAMIAFVMTMSLRDINHLGEKAENIFCALGVPKWERFRIKPFSISNVHTQSDPNWLRKGYIFKFADAMAAHKKKYNLQ
ncbi:hypothetical protein CR105_01375 [Massilia eurypsychrophila]|uniref:Uncharacterized protein n=1 Tax=Massilia eurypsychrophila TaxID=1485217 RepID=A0A2G8TLG7_9BURK|nr:hypothetical protein [Massilia eurypsychrophila]PIL46829.1 hypothetical protein CR105_01375 [Massilia eurypsychrophila]